MHSREQYLAALREEYVRGTKKQKTRLLNEARKRTHLNRKVLIRKLSRIPAAVGKKRKRTRKPKYGAEVKAPLAKIWELFDFPCGQRMGAVLREQVEKLRASGDLKCSAKAAELLRQMSPKTIDRLLAHERDVRSLKQHRRPPVHPLLYQRVPTKTSAEWDRQQVGNLQLDYVLHCGRSAAGEYVVTLSATDIATGWWEGSAQMGRSQHATQESVERILQRTPFRVLEVHPDNDSGILNDLLWNYFRKRRIGMSRSRPYMKNDNAWVEQKNFTPVRKLVGYGRFTTAAQLEVFGELYEAAADFRNFLQPAIKLKEKVRVVGKVKRVYEEPRTPYQRLRELGARYQAINPVKLRRRIEELRTKLFDLLESEGEQTAGKARRHGPSIELGRRKKKADQ